MKKSNPRITATIAMVIGSAFVFCAVVAMNAFTRRPEAVDTAQVVAFAVENPTLKKKKKEVPKIEKRKKRRSEDERLLSVLPDLGTSLSGIQIGIPDFQNMDLGGLSDSLLGDMDRAVMTDEAVDKKPRPRVRAHIPYPARARANSITGFVVFNLFIGTDGAVKKAKVLEANPPGVFDSVALESIRSWIFEPAVYQQKQVAGWFKQRINFRLN
jgi:TonB family protein